MRDRDDPWRESVELAQEITRRANAGNVPAAMDALRGAAVGLRDVLGGVLVEGRLPDPERRIYLRFLLNALEQIDQGIEPGKALGIWGGKRVSEDRDVTLFLKVGVALDRLRAKSIDVEKPVARAIEIVAKRTGCGTPTVEKAWKSYGGEDAWNAAASATEGDA